MKHISKLDVPRGKFFKNPMPQTIYLQSMMEKVLLAAEPDPAQ
jgi:hypothetical protein